MKLCQDKGILIESYGGLTPIVRAPGGPLDPVLETIRSRLEKTDGKPVSAGQVLSKWILQKGAVVVTYVIVNLKLSKKLIIFNIALRPRPNAFKNFWQSKKSPT